MACVAGSAVTGREQPATAQIAAMEMIPCGSRRIMEEKGVLTEGYVNAGYALRQRAKLRERACHGLLAFLTFIFPLAHARSYDGGRKTEAERGGGET